MKEVIFFDLHQTLINVDIHNEKEGQRLGFEKIIIPYLLSNNVSDQEASLVLSHYLNAVEVFYNINNRKLFHHNFAKILSEVFRVHYGLSEHEVLLHDLIHEFRKVSRGYIEIYSGVREMLQQLSAQYTLGIASYTQGSYSERELEELDMLKFFTHRIYSSDIGLRKKSDLFYKKCIEIANVLPSQCVMVGDNLEDDVYMAQESGMHAVWVVHPTIKDSLPSEVPLTVQISIESIRDISKIIEKILRQS